VGIRMNTQGIMDIIFLFSAFLMLAAMVGLIAACDNQGVRK
jgi:hypothetical protein